MNDLEEFRRYLGRMLRFFGIGCVVILVFIGIGSWDLVPIGKAAALSVVLYFVRD